MSKNEIIKFSNFISNIISKLLKNISFLVMIGNIISLVRVWLFLNLNFVLLYLIVDYWFNYISECNGWFYCTTKFSMSTV